MAGERPVIREVTTRTSPFGKFCQLESVERQKVTNKIRKRQGNGAVASSLRGGVNRELHLQGVFSSSAPVCGICGKHLILRAVCTLTPQRIAQPHTASMGLLGFCVAGTRGRRWRKSIITNVLDIMGGQIGIANE